jgi:hypothetical protein
MIESILYMCLLVHLYVCTNKCQRLARVAVIAYNKAISCGEKKRIIVLAGSWWIELYHCSNRIIEGEKESTPVFTSIHQFKKSKWTKFAWKIGTEERMYESWEVSTLLFVYVWSHGKKSRPTTRQKHKSDLTDSPLGRSKSALDLLQL